MPDKDHSTGARRVEGISQSIIAAYETGAKSPTFRTIENLARSQYLELVV